MAKQKRAKSQSENQTKSVPCNICKNEVSEGVCCDGCENWAHAKCIFPGLTISILKSPNLIYRCDDCISHKNVKNTLSELKSSVDDLSKSIAPRLVIMQEKLQKLENTVKTNATYAERVKQNTWDAKKSFVVNKIRNFNDARESSSIKIALSHYFPRTKFLHTMKTADGRIIVETENENTAKEISQKWPENFFGGSECRKTKAKRPLKLILKGVPSPDHAQETVVDEKDLQEEISKQVPGSIVTRAKRQDTTPLKVLNITLENEEQVEGVLKSGVCIGNLWIQPEIEYRPPKVEQCFKCLKFGHISACCAANRSTNTVNFVRKKAIITRTVPTGRTKSVKIVTEVTLQFPGIAQSSKRN